MGIRRGAPLMERILAHVSVEDRGYFSPCWVWTGNLTTEGYGSIRVGSRTDGTRRMRHAHRVAYEAKYGDFPSNMDPDHLCRVRACCNPEHIQPVSHSENVRRGSSPAALKRRFASMTSCKRGHEYTAENTYLYVSQRGYTHRRCRACKNELRRVK